MMAGPAAAMCRSSSRPRFLRLRVRRGRLLLLVAPPGRPIRLAFIAERRMPYLRYLTIHTGKGRPHVPGDRPAGTGERRADAPLSAA